MSDIFPEDIFPEIDSAGLEEAFRALDDGGTTQIDVSRGPSMLFVFRYEGPHNYYTSGDFRPVLDTMPRDLAEAIVNLCEALDRYQQQRR